MIRVSCVPFYNRTDRISRWHIALIRVLVMVGFTRQVVGAPPKPVEPAPGSVALVKPGKTLGKKTGRASW